MANWKYKLKNSQPLRDAIHNGDLDEVLNQLEVCWKEINFEFPDEYDDRELSSDLDDIENERDNILNAEEYDLDDYELEDNVDYLLSNLYDECDGLGIWIEI